jgi:hypothetical protein
VAVAELGGESVAYGVEVAVSEQAFAVPQGYRVRRLLRFAAEVRVQVGQFLGCHSSYGLSFRALRGRARGGAEVVGPATATSYLSVRGRRWRSVPDFEELQPIADRVEAEESPVAGEPVIPDDGRAMGAHAVGEGVDVPYA